MPIVSCIELAILLRHTVNHNFINRGFENSIFSVINDVFGYFHWEWLVTAFALDLWIGTWVRLNGVRVLHSLVFSTSDGHWYVSFYDCVRDVVYYF